MDIIDIVDNGAENEDIIFDLTNRTTNVDVAHIVSVTTCLTGTHEVGFRERAFSVTLTSMSTLAAFTAELKILRGLPLGSPMSIIIRYYLDNNASLDDVRLDALALLHATGCRYLSKPVCIEVYSKSGTAPINSYTISLEDIRQSILLFMYQIFKKSPEHMLAQLPRIWMSGRGEAREAEWDLSKCSIKPIVNENVGISSTIIQSRYEEIKGSVTASDMSATPGTAAGGATPATVSDAESSDMAITKIANTQKDTEAATSTDNVPPPVSHPIDPNAPSLLNLPGEVRNAIYEALFIHEYPIQIHAKNINRLGYHSGYRSDRIISGTALLQSCCQIQYEATGVLYARNVFRLGLPEDADQRSGTIWAMDWLRIIGKQSSSLRVIQLDVNNLLDADETLEVLPILEHTWKLEHKKMNVLFVALLEVHSSKSYFQSNREWSASHMARINKSLSTLTADPSNLLRKYWNSKMLLRVGLDTDESEVYVSYRHNDSGGGNWMTKSRMSISDEGELRVIPPNRNTEFCDLMSIYSVRKRLFDLFQPPGVELTFDLAHQTTNSNLRSLAGVNRWLRHEAISEVCDVNSTFNSATSTPKYNFATELERFTAIRLRGRPRYFHLYFDLPKHSTLEDVRFDALLLLSAMDSVNRKVHLEIETN
ncbi:uncharacterized protein J4E87_008517 [Alternaria ethzedia]|uniref:uncharacterized protein n=1 Tax=Alternaria ethzedia TaxID=181014 RepID=UPI0020C3EADC|nr:uncharacterized protein J4E87_008517 [Alternaria ethzedia]KAI4617005.1 hypothetical protein J4E87_008517 [Alternaria ethzedia]